MTRTATGPGVRLLYVDDEPEFADLAAAVIERKHEDAMVDAVTDAETGLELLEETHYDCIVSDYEMPRMDGLAFLERVRDRGHQIPFILFTGRGSEEIASEAIAAGATDYLQKRGDAGQWDLLWNRITNAIESHRGAQQLREYRAIVETVGDPMFVVDEDGILTLATAALAERLGVHADDLVGRHVTDVFDVDSEAFQEAVAAIATEPSRCEATARDGAGTTTDVAIEVTPLEPARNGHTGAVGMVRVAEEPDRQLERLETILRALGDPVYAVDEEGRITFVNDAYVAHAGLSREELLGKPVESFRRSSEIAKVQSVIEELLASDSRSRATVELERMHPDGDVRQVENHIALLPSEDGRYRGSAGVVRDVTDRVERERKLEQFRSLVHAMTDPACIYDREGRFVLVNQTLAEWYDAPPEALYGERSSMIDYIQAQEPGDPYAELMAGEREEIRGEFDPSSRRIRGDIVEYRLTPLEIEGEIEGAVAVSRDISDRKARERKLRETRTVLRTVVDNLPVGVVVADADHTILIANDTFGELFDLESAGEALADRDWPAVAEEVATQFEDPDGFTASLRERIESRELVRHQEWEMADGRTVERDFIPYSLLGKPASLWLFRDVTNRRERERELKAQNERLEEFASIVSHDLRNPLNVAQGRLDLAMTEVENEHLEDVARAHERIQSLIEDLLAMAREGVGPSQERVDLAELFSSCWDTVATGEATARVETDQVIDADPARLRQALENLIRNAIEHGGEDVTITIGDLPDGFYLEDDGVGIPADERDTVFEAGYTTTRKGTGLGLNIVAQVVQEHEWAIQLTESAEGGARFEICGV